MGQQQQWLSSALQHGQKILDGGVQGTANDLLFICTAACSVLLLTCSTIVVAWALPILCGRPGIRI